MIDWLEVISNAFWLAGLALVLAVASYADYRRSLARLPARATWDLLVNSGWARLGGLLFCAGMALTTGAWLERGLWGLFALYLPYQWWHGQAISSTSRPPSTPPQAGSPPGAAASASPPRHSATQAVKALAERVIELELLWLALLAPFVLFLFPARAGVAALLGLPILWVARRIARGRFITRTPLDWAICLLMLMVLVSLYATPDLSLSLPKVSGLLLGIGLYYAIVEWVTTPARLGRAVYACALGGAALALVGLFATDWTDKFHVLTSLGSKLPAVLRGLPGVGEGINPNELAGALVWIIPLQLAVLGWGAYRRPGAQTRTAPRLLILAPVAVTGIAMILTQSRGGFFGLTLGLALLLWLALPRARLLFAALALAGVVVTLAIGPWEISDSLSQRYGHGLRIDSALSSLQARATIWAHAIYGIEDFPLTGMGMDSFRRLLPILYPIKEFSPDANLPHAHNHLLQTALDLGLPGLAAYLAIWMLAAGLVALTIRGSPGGWQRAMLAALGAGLLAYFAFGITDTVPLGARPGLFFWALLALVAAIFRLTPGKRRNT